MKTVIDLFCGAGGMSLGFRQAGYTPIFANDEDRHAIETYRANFGDHAMCGDIRQITDFPTAEVVIGGPPCQGFSRLGKQTYGAPTDKSYEGNELWREYMRCVAQVKPKVFVVENVADFFKHFAWEGIQGTAEELGYQLSAAVLNAADYGVPQRRHRAIVIGSRVGKPDMPPPTHQAPSEQLSFLALPHWCTVGDAIRDLSLEPDGKNRHTGRSVSQLSLDRYMHVPPGGNRKNLPEDLMPDCWKYKSSRSGGSADLMGRLQWDKPALTIRTQFLKPEKGRYLHPEAHRSLTVREGARLQTFPDDFIFVGSNFQTAKQIGNAVPVLLSRRIAEHVTRHIEMHAKGNRESFALEAS